MTRRPCRCAAIEGCAEMREDARVICPLAPLSFALLSPRLADYTLGQLSWRTRGGACAGGRGSGRDCGAGSAR